MIGCTCIPRTIFFQISRGITGQSETSGYWWHSRQHFTHSTYWYSYY